MTTLEITGWVLVALLALPIAALSAMMLAALLVLLIGKGGR